VTGGQTAVYTVVVSNLANTGPTTGTVVVVDHLPDGLTPVSASGSGWTCGTDGLPLCTRSDVLAPGASYPPITLMVSVAANAPATITNTVAVLGGGDRSPANNTASDTALNPGLPADLSITKVPIGTFIAGQTGGYTIVVSNAATAGPTIGAVTVTDTMPTGLTAISASGNGWSCAVGPAVSCFRSDTLAPGAHYPAITLMVSVAANAPPTVDNTATISGGGDATPGTSPPNPVPIGRPPDLSLTKTRTVDLVAGQPATYSIVVSNAATAGPTTSAVAVAVADTLPSSLTATAASGPGWSCTAGATVSCTRSDVLPPGASFPPITLTVQVAPDASGTIINSATVNGGGDQTPGNNSGADEGTAVTNTCLAITGSVDPNFGSSSTGTFQLVVSNPGSTASSGRVVVAGTPPLFGQPVAASGSGWDCQIAAQAVTCDRTDTLAPGAQFPPITVAVKVIGAAGGSSGNASFYVVNASCVRPASIPIEISGGGPAGPEVTLVTNGASFLTPGQSNYGIAPGSLVSIFGIGIGPTTPASLPALPLDPTGFAGVHVDATVGTTTLPVPVFFASSGQLNALLPSQTPPGDGTLVVTFNGQATPPFPIRVVPTNVGIFTPNRQGYGPGVAQNAFPQDVVQVTTPFTPATPGQIVELWATGLGAVQGNEFATPLPGNLDVPVQVYVGGQFVTPVYAGRSGCCVGTDQIHFVMPQSVHGCYVPVFVKASGVVSNTVTLSVSSNQPCVDSALPTGTDLQELEAGGALIGATATLNRSILPAATTHTDYALTTFQNQNQSTILNNEPEFPVPVVGSCTVGQTRTDGQGLAPAAPLFVPADASSIFPFRERPNAYLTVPGVEVSKESQSQPLTQDSVLRYVSLLGSSTYFDPGTVIESNLQSPGSPGFLMEPVDVPAAPQVVGWQQPGSTLPQAGNMPIIDRSIPLTVTWSGGDLSTDQAVIAGFKSITSLSAGRQGTTATSWFVCTADLGTGSFTVPAEVLQAMPTGSAVAGPSGTQLPWLPGGSLNETTAQKSSLSIGSIRRPDLSWFTVPGLDFARLMYVLATKQDVDYK
jgi:uncharacterized protein (TIGR03437 family)